MLRIITVPYLLVTGLLSQAQSSIVSWGGQTDCDMAGQGYSRPRIAINGNGDPVVLIGDMASDVNRVAVGNGVSFSPAQLITPPGVTAAVDYWQGSELATLGNEVWVSFKRTPEMEQAIYALSSTDGGYTWGDTIRVNSDDPWSRFSAIALASPGEPLVQYMQFDSGFSNARYVVRRMNGGVFQAPVQVSTPYAPGHVCDCCPGQVTAQGTDVVALYRNAGPNIRVIHGAASTDGGDSFPVGGELDPTNWNLAACPSSGPDGAIGGDSLRFVWMSGALNGTKVYARSAALDDLSTGPLVEIFPGQPTNQAQNFPRIAGSGDTLGIVWEQAISGSREVLFSWSTTGLNGLGAPDTVNTSMSGSQRTPDITYADGSFHIVWSDESAGVVRYRKATIQSSVAVQEHISTGTVRAWPQPATDLVHLDVVSGTPVAVWELINAQGRSLRTLPGTARTIDRAGLPAGTYTLSGSDAQGRRCMAVPVVFTQ